MILIKSHKFCYSFEKMQKLGISYLKEVKIKTQLIIKNNYILGKFEIYNRLLRQFKSKWNKQRNKENNLNRLDIVLKEEENKKENNSKSKRRQSTLKFLRKLYNSKPILGKSNIINNFGQDSKTVENTEGITRIKL